MNCTLNLGSMLADVNFQGDQLLVCYAVAQPID